MKQISVELIHVKNKMNFTTTTLYNPHLKSAWKVYILDVDAMSGKNGFLYLP